MLLSSSWKNTLLHSSYQGWSAIIISLIRICPWCNQTFQNVEVTIIGSTIHPHCQLCFLVSNSQVEVWFQKLVLKARFFYLAPSTKMNYKLIKLELQVKGLRNRIWISLDKKQQTFMLTIILTSIITRGLIVIISKCLKQVSYRLIESTD